ncbi:hypothetical protein KVR01_003397 [Diaporthe batatas]|uniref:uncharacterized protein n=1 Tax=Diaporthe batatas TaxID=748121 RepID=UPI001D041516|nr:uncharacterized protein KVR01_003397 [Diaporthe batatas]KAG8167708.1 hypothetical protein KVR01_003397 [Diaporthe batatas]
MLKGFLLGLAGVVVVDSMPAQTHGQTLTAGATPGATPDFGAGSFGVNPSKTVPNIVSDLVDNLIPFHPKTPKTTTEEPKNSSTSSSTTTPATTSVGTTETDTTKQNTTKNFSPATTSSTIAPLPTGVKDVVNSLDKSKKNRDLAIGLGVGCKYTKMGRPLALTKPPSSPWPCHVGMYTTLGVGVPAPAGLFGWISKMWASSKGDSDVATTLGEAMPRMRLGEIPDYSGASSYSYSDLTRDYHDFWGRPGEIDTDFSDLDFYDESISSDQIIERWIDQIEKGASKGGSPPSGSTPGGSTPGGSPQRGFPPGGSTPGGSTLGGGDDGSRGDDDDRDRWGEESRGESLGSHVSDALDRLYQTMAEHGYDHNAAHQALHRFGQDLARAEASVAREDLLTGPGSGGSGNGGSNAATVVDQAANAALSEASQWRQVRLEGLVKNAAEKAAGAYSNAERFKALEYAGVPDVVVQPTWNDVADAMEEARPRGTEAVYEAALNTIADRLTMRDVDFAEAGNVAWYEGKTHKAFKEALSTAGFVEDSFDRTIKHVGDAIDSATHNNADPVCAAIRAVREAAAFPPNVRETRSWSVNAPDEIKKALLDVLKSSHNFWPRYANAMYDVLKKLENKPHSKVLDDMLADGPPPKMAPYRGIYYPYRRGTIPGHGVEPVPVTPVEAHRDFIYANSTAPWFCGNHTHYSLMVSASEDKDVVADGLRNLNDGQDRRDRYLARLRDNQDRVAKLANAVPIALCRLRLDPHMPDYQTPATMGYNRTSHALLRMWKSVLQSKSIRIDAGGVNDCANLTSKQFSDVKSMSNQSLYEATDKYHQLKKTSLEKLARDDHVLFHWIRTWSVPIVQCKLQLLLRTPDTPEEDLTKYRTSIQSMSEVAQNLYDINAAAPIPTAPPQDPIHLPKLEWPFEGRGCPFRWKFSGPPKGDGPEGTKEAVKFTDQVIDHLDTFQQRRGDYLQYMKEHENEIVKATEAVDEMQCLTRVGWGLDKKLWPILQDMSLALRTLFLELHAPAADPAKTPEFVDVETPTSKLHMREHPFCPDFRQHGDLGSLEDPRFMVLLYDPQRKDEEYRRAFEGFKKLAFESMDLFKKYGDGYLRYMRSRPEELALTIKVLKDMDCAIRGEIRDRFLEQKKKAFSPFLDTKEKVDHYTTTLLKMLKALQQLVTITRPTSMPEVFKLCRVRDGELQCPLL